MRIMARLVESDITGPIGLSASLFSLIGPSLPVTSGRIKALAVFSIFLFSAEACGPAGEAEAVGTGVADRPFATLEVDQDFPEPFSYLSGVRELPDGRLLAADPMSEVLLLLDLGTGTADTLGGPGEGPQEYRGPDHVLPLRGDSTLLVDLGNGRLTMVDPEGVFREWIPMARQTKDGRARSIHPRFADSAGFLYVVGPSDADGIPEDSTSINRLDRASGTETVVGWSWHPDWRALRRGGKRPLFTSTDDWAVGPDGRVAVVRANGYSVDWYFPDGRTVVGSPHDAELYPVGEAEKLAQLQLFASSAIMTFGAYGADGSVSSRQLRRGVPSGSGPEMDEFWSTEDLPLFRGGSTLVSPLGEAWVFRHLPHGASSRYEVFDSRGIRRGFVELDVDSRIIGFGTRPETEDMAYLTRTDEVGLVWLERHRILREEG